MIELAGDFGGLATLKKKLEETPRMLLGVSSALRSVAATQYRAGFAEQRAPSGAAWAPNKDGHTPIGRRTGALSKPATSIRGWEVTVEATPHYAEFFARRRPIFPPDGAAEQWGPPIEDRIEQLIEKHFSE